MNKIVKLNIAIILGCGAICSSYSSRPSFKETRQAFSTVARIWGTCAVDVWKERGKTAEKGLTQVLHKLTPIESFHSWARAFAKNLKVEKVTLLSLIDEFQTGNLADEREGLPECWSLFAFVAKEVLIPTLLQSSDPDHSILVWQIRLGLGCYLAEITDQFSYGWEDSYDPRPSSKISTFINHFRTFLFDDKVKTLAHYLNNCVIPTLSQIEQYPNREEFGDEIEQAYNIVKDHKERIEGIIAKRQFTVTDELELMDDIVDLESSESKLPALPDPSPLSILEENFKALFSVISQISPPEPEFLKTMLKQALEGFSDRGLLESVSEKSFVLPGK
jgi:hypothetical protein